MGCGGKDKGKGETRWGLCTTCRGSGLKYWLCTKCNTLIELHKLGYILRDFTGSRLVRRTTHGGWTGCGERIPQILPHYLADPEDSSSEEEETKYTYGSEDCEMCKGRGTACSKCNGKGILICNSYATK